MGGDVGVCGGGGGSVPARPIWRTIGPAHCQFGPQVFEKYKESNKIILDLAQSLFQIWSIMFKLAQEQKP